MKPKSGMRLRGPGTIQGQPISRSGAIAHARQRLPRYSPRSGIAGPGSAELAGTTVRIVAYLLDTAIVSVVLTALWVFVEHPAAQGVTGDWAPSGDVRWAVGEVLVAAYFIALWTGGRRTLAMHWFRIRVVRSQSGGPVTFLPAVARWLVLGLPGVVFGVAYDVMPADATMLAGIMGAFVSWIWPLILLTSVVRSPTREGIHDRLAGTAVVVSER